MNKRTIPFIPVSTDRNNAPHGAIIPVPANMHPEDICDLIAASIFASHIMNDMMPKKNASKETRKQDTPKNPNTKHETAIKPEQNCKCNCPCENDQVETVSMTSVNYYGTTTVVKWSDNQKTIAVCDKDDTFDPITGFAIAVAKKFMGNAAFHDAVAQISAEMVNTSSDVENNTTPDVMAMFTKNDDKSNTDTDAASKPEKSEKKSTSEKSTAKKTTKKTATTKKSSKK